MQDVNAPALPSPGPADRARSERLGAALRRRIAAAGPLRFDAWWDAVLYSPGLGYYASAPGPFGPGGDFVTAPELGEAFGRCLARQLAAPLRALPGAEIVEFGAGSGRLAAVVLETLAQLGTAPRRYRILERSAGLATAQRQLLGERVPALAERVSWLESLPADPWQGVVIANEVLDALAPRRLLRDGRGWRELHVGLDGQRFAWEPRPLPPELEARVAQIEAHWEAAPALPYVTEVQTLVAPWVAAATASLERGLLLLCDYGYEAADYYRAERRDGTLICHYRHRAFVDPFLWPGLVDLSVSVDFSEVARGARSAGLRLAGYLTQADFLLNTGIEEDLAALEALPEAERLTRAAELKRLLLPGQMGERFKVLAATRGWDAALAGFASGDRLTRL